MNRHSQLARRTTAPIALPSTGYVTIAGKRHLVKLEPTDAPIESVAIAQERDYRPAHYETMRARGNDTQTLPTLALPNILNVSIAAVVALSFLVAASMFSISLTAYSNSVDRVNADRRPNSFINVK